MTDGRISDNIFFSGVLLSLMCFFLNLTNLLCGFVGKFLLIKLPKWGIGLKQRGLMGLL